MAAYYTRSNSLPSRPQPLIPEFDEQLCRFGTSEAASSSASTSLGRRLSGLQDLHDCVDRLLLLTLNQRAISQHQKCADQILDGSLRILDVYNIDKDVLLQTKESAQQLQSVLRKRRGASDLSSEVKKFLTSRRAVKKAIHKAIANLKCISSKCNKDQETLEIVKVMREVEVITLGVMEPLLSFISGPKSSGWSLISLMMQPKRLEEESQLNEFAMIDAALDFLMAHKTKKYDNFHLGNAQTILKNWSCAFKILKNVLRVCLGVC
ncbi:hypothetical protein FEM48_Zijuj09G0157100 [Ziziphus jujuba var. spinosa]|uniref:Uncharacterized protein n=1 Tax=Ziziphus jujuba var. spinosa TaxID=714518 RepID=A0A978UTV3_ZIZJJ|nr:hypothetical protein FEM48_Zijuj09G0157100 [Ziziphus jujuba var. spinosa]